MDKEELIEFLKENLSITINIDDKGYSKEVIVKLRLKDTYEPISIDRAQLHLS